MVLVYGSNPRLDEENLPCAELKITTDMYQCTSCRAASQALELAGYSGKH